MKQVPVSSPMTRDTHTPIAQRLAGELSLPVMSQLGFEHQNFRFRGERSNYNPLRHRIGAVLGGI